MRKTWSSSKCWWTSAFSLRALARSVPNGFSMITRRQAGASADARPPSPELLDDRLVHAGRNGQVVQHALGAVDLVELRLEPLIQRGVAQLARHVEDAPGQRARHLVVALDLGELAQAVLELIAKAVVVHRRPADADDREARRQAMVARQVVDRRQQLPLGQVARGAEDDESGRSRSGFDAEIVAERIRGRHSGYSGSTPDRSHSTAAG